MQPSMVLDMPDKEEARLAACGWPVSLHFGGFRSNDSSDDHQTELSAGGVSHGILLNMALNILFGLVIMDPCSPLRARTQ